VLELLDVVAQLAELAGADPGEREREEHQEDRLATQVCQVHGRPVGIRKSEIGSTRTQFDNDRGSRQLDRTHRPRPRVPSLVADQSGAIDMVLVACRPAVVAASSITLCSTWPVRPALGVKTQMTPWSSRTT
jgi:hypothetical protein